ncbi:MAG: PEP-CTERM sorting domain-containing protein [Verrucomicrobiota bacterium]
MTTKCFLLLAGSLLVAGSLQAQISITGGDLYVFQDGSGTTATYQDGGGAIAAASGTGSAVFIDQFSTSANGLIAQTAVPTTATAGVGLLTSGDNAQDGELTYDPNSDVLVFGGDSGTAVGSSITPAYRDIGQVNASGASSVAVTTANQSYFGSTGGSTSGGLLRGAVTDGNGNYWASGTAASGGDQGVWYYGNPNSNAAGLIGTGTAGHAIETYGGNLFYTTSGELYEIAGQPQSGTQTPIGLFTSGLSTAYGFAINPTTMTTVYIANEGGGIVRATYSGTFSGGAYSGGSWTTSVIDSGTDFDWLTVKWSGSYGSIYATTITSSGTGNNLVEITDPGTGTSLTQTVLDTISSSSTDAGQFDGLVFVPTSVPEPSVFALAGLGLMLCIGNWRRTRHQR